MSSMIPQPPPEIQIGGGGGGPPPMDGGGDPGGGTPGKIDMAEAKKHVLAAIQSIEAAAVAEGDPQDEATLKTLAAKLMSMVGANQGLEDQAMGAGPGVKLIRKSTQPEV